MQKMLNSAGFPVGAVHGRFGPKTAVAVKKYQSSRGLSAEGIIGPKTWAVLKAAADDLTDQCPSTCRSFISREVDTGGAS